MFCHGQNLEAHKYPELYSVILTTYGGKNESGTFKFTLPDLRSRIIIGAGQGKGLTDRQIADTGGEESHVTTDPQASSGSNNVPAHIILNYIIRYRYSYDLNIANGR
jgi:microcystin-dependent protein